MAAQQGSGRKLAIVVGGGPAPGINGVIASVTIAALNRGYTVFGCQDGFKHLAVGSSENVRELTYADVEPYALRGGSMLGTARTNPTKKAEDMANVLGVYEKLGVTDVVTIGGDDTAYTSSQIKAKAPHMHVAHVPKTIDNDLPLPSTTPTFGYETARHYGTMIAKAMLEDARTTSRWYILISMGRAAGHLALGIGRASASHVTLIPEEFDNKPTLDGVRDHVLGSVFKRASQGHPWGVAVLAEGIIDKIGGKALIEALGGEDKLARYGDIVYDEHGNLRMAEIQIGRLVRDYIEKTLSELKVKVGFVTKDIGYELRCIDPVPFDCEYTRELGYAAVKFLGDPRAEEFGAIISVVGGEMEPLPFEEKLNPETKKMSTRQVNVNSQAFECALSFMDRLDADDFADGSKLGALAGAANTTPEDFRKRFGHVVS